MPQGEASGTINDRGPNGPDRGSAPDQTWPQGTQGGVSPQVPRQPGQMGPYGR